MELLNIFSKIDSETKTLPYQEIKVLYSLCLKIACGYIAKVHSDKFCSQNRWNDTIDDVASDCVVPLFVNNEHDTLHIIHSYNNWNLKILTENDARFFVSRLVWNRVEQRMAKVLKERDPIFNKIHKTLSNCVDGKNFKKLTFFGRSYFVNADAKEIYSPVIDYDEFNNIPASTFYKKRASLLIEIFNYISKNTIFFPAIPVNILVNRIKSLYREQNEFESNVQPIYEQEIDLNTALNNSLTNLKENLHVKYYSTNKLSRDECTIVEETFNQISLDLVNGGMKGSLYSYLKEVDNNISSEIFYSKYHGIVNYLYKDFKSEIETFFDYE